MLSIIRASGKPVFILQAWEHGNRKLSPNHSRKQPSGKTDLTMFSSNSGFHVHLKTQKDRAHGMCAPRWEDNARLHTGQPLAGRSVQHTGAEATVVTDIGSRQSRMPRIKPCLATHARDAAALQQEPSAHVQPRRLPQHREGGTLCVWPSQQKPCYDVPRPCQSWLSE